MPRPTLIKAGDTRLLLGNPPATPKVDCRVVAEDEYQHMLTLLETAADLITQMNPSQQIAFWQRDYQHWQNS